jgi:hypothetical protein
MPNNKYNVNIRIGEKSPATAFALFLECPHQTIV